MHGGSLRVVTAMFLLVTVSACSEWPRQTTLRSAMPTHHTIDYIEISVTDVPDAKRFYAAAFDWEFNDYGPDYAGIKGGSGEVGGIARSEDVRHGGPLVVLYSDHLESSLDAVKAAGGRIVKAIFPFPGGRRFHFTDPSGNELAVWSPDGEQN